MHRLVETNIEDERWQQADLKHLASRAAEATLGMLELPPAGFEVSVLGCSDHRIAVLNADFRDKPRATNVLSWPAEERGADVPGDTPDLPSPSPDGLPVELGDIAIAFETCEAEAAAAGIKFEDHVSHLLVHGVLHLFGYDHERDEDAALMERLEVETLDKLGIKSPYSQ